MSSAYSYAGSAAPNELQSVSASGVITTYAYDKNGDTTSITSTGGLNTRLGYDSKARLSTVTLADGTQVVMRYNAAGQRSRYTVAKGGATSLDEQFTYRGGELAQAVVVSGTQTYTDTYLYAPNGLPLELLRQQGGSTSRYWYEEDGQGSVVALTDSSGTVVDRYAYDAWGAPTSASETVPQPFRYAGYWWDAALGWYWVGVRPYDPQLKRWLQPDPSEQDGVRTYNYAHDNPTDATDPSGLCSIGPINLPVGGSEPCINDIARELHNRAPYLRWPDYIVLSIGGGHVFHIGFLPIPVVGSGNITLSRYGRWYWGGAVGFGTPGRSIYVGAGWIFQPSVPSDAYLDSFISGWSISGNVVTSAHVGGAIVWGEVPESSHVNDIPAPRPLYT